MCYGFSTIVKQDGSIYWVEPDSDGNIHHNVIIKRLGLIENANPIMRDFVRTECATWTDRSFLFDESGTLPVWVKEDEIKERVCKLMARVKKVWKEYTNNVRQAEKLYKGLINSEKVKYFTDKTYSLREANTKITEYQLSESNAYDTLSKQYLIDLKKITGYVIRTGIEE